MGSEGRYFRAVHAQRSGAGGEAIWTANRTSSCQVRRMSGKRRRRERIPLPFALGQYEPALSEGLVEQTCQSRLALHELFVERTIIPVATFPIANGFFIHNWRRSPPKRSATGRHRASL